MRYVTTALIGLVGVSAQAQTPSFEAFDQRVTALETRVDGIERRLGPPFLRDTPRDHSGDGKRTYASAYNLALDTGKPLLVWHGDAICERCVHESEGEFVNYVGAVPGLPTNVVTVGVPENGELVVAGVVDRWVTSDPVHGHLPSSRRVLANWRANRASRAAASATNSPRVMVAGAPMTMGGGMMGGMMMGSGGCASCGSSSSVGFFGRRR